MVLYKSDELTSQYPTIGLFFHSFTDYLKSPVKAFVYDSVTLPDGFPLFKYFRNHITSDGHTIESGDIIEDGIYYINYYGNEYVKSQYEILKLSLDDHIVFIDAFNLSSNIIPDDLNIFKVYAKTECYQTEDGYWMPNVYRNGNRIPYVIPSDKHSSVGDILKYGYRYTYNIDQKIFKEESNEELIQLRLFKGKIRLDVLRQIGDADERLSDYARLIYTMMRTSNYYQSADPELQSKIDQLAINDDETIHRIVDRDIRIQDLVKQYIR